MTTWSCAARKDLPIIIRSSWSGAEARERLFARAEEEGWDTIRGAFLVYDKDAAGTRDAYALPFADVVDGALLAVDSGIRSAAQTLSRVDIPASVAEAARAVLDAYYERLDEAKGAEGWTGEEGTIIRGVEEADVSVATGDTSAAVAGAPEREQLYSGDGQVTATGKLLTASELAGYARAAGVPMTPERGAQAAPRAFVPGVEAEPDPLRDSGAVFAHPARVQASPMTRAAVDDLDAMVQGIALDPSIFRERPPFFWRAEISSNRLDSYYTRMSPKTTLRNFAEDAQAGVSFQDSHEFRALGFGRSLTGKFYNAQGNGVARTEADFFTVPGLQLNRVNTTHLIDGIRAGLVRDVSVGFSSGEFICSLCGRDMLRDWDCWHIPGLYYLKDDEEGFPVSPEERGAELAWASVENARLSEVSAVYDGATPGAAVLKAYRAAEAGQIRAANVRGLLERRYRMALPASSVQGRGFSPSPSIEQEVVPMAGQANPERRDPAQQEHQVELELTDLAPVRAALDVAGAPDGEDVIRRIAWLALERQKLLPAAERLAQVEERLQAVQAENQTLRSTDHAARIAELEADVARLSPLAERATALAPLEVEVAELRPLREQVAQLATEAADGRTYRADLVEQALAEGVRAFGDGFDKATYEPMLKGAPLQTIKRFVADWGAVAAARYPGGRQIQEPAPAEEKKPAPEGGAERDAETGETRRLVVPAAAYRA